MSFSGPAGYQMAADEKSITSKEIRLARDKIAMMMLQNLPQTYDKTISEATSTYNTQIEQQPRDDELEEKHNRIVKNSSEHTDEGLALQTQNLMSDIVKVMKDKDLQNQLQSLMDQEISKPTRSGGDFKNMINRMHEGISKEQHRLRYERSNLLVGQFSLNDSNYSPSISMNKSAQFGFGPSNSRSKSPALSSQTQQIIQQKQLLGEYKPIHERLDDIKERHEQIIQRTREMYTKPEEPLPTFKPTINHDQSYSYYRYQKLRSESDRQDNPEQKWYFFLDKMNEWDSQKKSKIEKKQSMNQTIYTFQPVINPATTEILENSAASINGYGSRNGQDVVTRLYTQLRDKDIRSKERKLQDSITRSPFKPKINSNSQKIFAKMYNGEKVTFEERIQLRQQQQKLSTETIETNTTPREQKREMQGKQTKSKSVSSLALNSNTKKPPSKQLECRFISPRDQRQQFDVKTTTTATTATITTTNQISSNSTLISQQRFLNPNPYAQKNLSPKASTSVTPRVLTSSDSKQILQEQLASDNKIQIRRPRRKELSEPATESVTPRQQQNTRSPSIKNTKQSTKNQNSPALLLPFDSKLHANNSVTKPFGGGGGGGGGGVHSPKSTTSSLRKSPLNFTMTVHQNQLHQLNHNNENHNSTTGRSELLSAHSKERTLNGQNVNELEYGENLRYILSMLRKKDQQLNKPQHSQQQQSLSTKHNNQKLQQFQGVFPSKNAETPNSLITTNNTTTRSSKSPIKKSN